MITLRAYLFFVTNNSKICYVNWNAMAPSNKYTKAKDENSECH